MKRTSRHSLGFLIALWATLLAFQTASGESPQTEMPSSTPAALTGSQWAEEIDSLQGQAEATRALWKKLLPILFRDIALSPHQVSQITMFTQDILKQREKVDQLRAELETAREAKDSAQIRSLKADLKRNGADIRPVDRMATLRQYLTPSQRKTFDMNRAIAITRLRQNEL